MNPRKNIAPTVLAEFAALDPLRITYIGEVREVAGV
jgi:hypothetical protein